MELKMPPSLDETYEPRIWRCEECRQILGVVMRDKNRVRRLWVFRADRSDAGMPVTFTLRQAPRGLYKVHGLDQSMGIECSKCGAITEWSMSKDAFGQLLRDRVKLREAVEAFDELAEKIKGSALEGVK
jgi:hypothetical protein